MKSTLIILFVLYSLTSLGNGASKVNLDTLNYYISHQSEYVKEKENRIRQLKTEINESGVNAEKLYPLYLSLYEEYRSYIYDSAYVCVEKLRDVSYALKDEDKITSSNVKMIFCYFSSGLFKESFDMLPQIDVSHCSDSTKVDFYTNKARFYYDLADYNNGTDFRREYDSLGNQSIDSAIILLPIELPRFWAAVGLKRMKSDNYAGAIDAFRKMIDMRDYSEHDLAIATSSLGYLFRIQGKHKEAREYLIQAAISDIKSSTKETVALRNLAQLLYEEGDIKNAAKYIRQALDDASFYNARHRQLEIGYILPIIEGDRMNMIEKQKDRMTVYLGFISILVIMLVFALIVIWLQLRKLNQAKSTIQKVNDDLIRINNDLTEVNKIKDEYIGYFFSLNSEFIEKMEAFQKWINRKIMARQFEDLQNIPKDLDVRKEREELFSRFDQVFLKLFPDFVNRFNELFKPEDRIHLKSGELLNTDLRIFALIRLGISDNEKIAKFLGYSVNTIYTYKTKIKNKSIVSNDDFEQKIMEIKSIKV